MASNHIRNIDGLKEYASSKKEEATNRVNVAIKKYVMENKKINFNSISVEADVSKTYLYTHEDIRKRIEELRMRHVDVFSEKKIKKEMNEISVLCQHFLKFFLN